MRRRLAGIVVCGVIALLGCSGGGDEAQPARTTPPSTSPSAPTTSSIASSTTAAVPAVTVAEPALPPGQLVAVPFRNRGDGAAGIFQVKLVHDGSDRVDVRRVRFRWDGFSATSGPRDDAVVPGQRIDFPVPFTGATCRDDGTVPDLAGARVELDLADGTQRTVPVVDLHGVARQLYLDDCDRQFVASQVTIEWTGLREGVVDGRPVTDAALTLTRRAATGAVTVTNVGNTINFTVDVPGRAPGGPVGTLSAGRPAVSVPVRFVEGRCDAHAVSESSQPFDVVVTVDLGDGGGPHAVVVRPPVDAQVAMRQRVEAGCAALDRLRSLGNTTPGG